MRVLLGPWPLQPALAFVSVFALLSFAANADSTPFDTADGWPLPKVAPAILVAAAAAAGPLYVARAWLLRGGRSLSRTGYLGAMVTAGLSLGLWNYFGRLGNPVELPADWRPLLFLVTRSTLSLMVVHSVGGVAMARTRQEAARAQEALAVVEEQRRVIVDTEERSRAAVARFLHDHVQASLVSVALQVREVAGQLPPDAADRLGSVVEALEDVRHREVRLAGRTLSPDLQLVGLRQALAELAEQYRGAVACRVIIDPDLLAWSRPGSDGDRQVLCAYRIIEQALLNSATHGRARNVDIRFVRDGDEVVLTIDDDGVGLATTGPVVPGTGTTVVSTWVALVRGTWSLEPGALGGARVTARFPITPAFRSPVQVSGPST